MKTKLDSYSLFSDIGIDSIGFFTPNKYLNLEELAKFRNEDPEKFKQGLLMKELRIPDVDEDIISMSLKAAYIALRKGQIDPKSIDALFVGTETVTYAVKSVSNILSEFIGISPNSLTQDVYNACAGGTLAVLNALALIEKGIINNAMVIAADISKYELNSPGEPTQGAGAIALILKKNPRIAAFSKNFGKVSCNINDFYRHSNTEFPTVSGKYSVNSYVNLQLLAFDDLRSQLGNFHSDYYVFHAPFAKLPLKAMQNIVRNRVDHFVGTLPKSESSDFKESIKIKIKDLLRTVSLFPSYASVKLKDIGVPVNNISDIGKKIIVKFRDRVVPQLKVPMHIGNMYSASVWAQLLYVLENYAIPNDKIYFGSYGSGATCISGLLLVKPNYKNVIFKNPKFDYFFANKSRISVQNYEKIHSFSYEPQYYKGIIEEHPLNRGFSFTYNVCEEGCILSNVKGQNYCPEGHSGCKTIKFPHFALLKSDPIPIKSNDKSFLTDGFVRLSENTAKGNSLEFNLRRLSNIDPMAKFNHNILFWIPTYNSIDERKINLFSS